MASDASDPFATDMFPAAPEEVVTLDRRDGAFLQLRVLGDGIVALRAARPGQPVGLPPGLLPAWPAAWPEPTDPIAMPWSLAAGSLTVRYGGDAAEDTLIFVDPSGHEIARTAGEAWWAADEKGAFTAWRLAPDVEVLGLGAKMGPFARRGRRFRFWNTDAYPHLPDTDPLYASLPFALVVGHAGSVFGLASLWGGETVWDVGHNEPNALRITSAHGGLETVLLAGPTPAAVMRRFVALFGKPVLPPLWALGYQQSHWGYGDAQTFLSVARTFRERHIPLDALYMDLDYMWDNHPLLWDRDRFPDPAAFVRELHSLNVRLVAITNAGVPVDDPRFPEAERTQALTRTSDGSVAQGRLWGGTTAITDVFRPEAQAFWRTQLEPFLADGVDGVWNDMNEPSFLLPEGEMPRGQGTLPADAVHVDAQGTRWRHDAVHNVFALAMDRATYDNLRQLRPNERPFVLSRAGYLGVGAFAALWGGDNASWWEHLRAMLPTVCGFGLAGVPMAGVDIGGFNGECSPELFARWIEAASLVPLCRNHSSLYGPHQEPYRFGPEVEEITRRHLKFRYRFLPTLYALLYAAHETGEPVWRPLGYAFPDDPVALRTETEVMIGPDLLMAPILEPAAQARSVYLPKGHWLRLGDGHCEPYEGPQHILAKADQAELPLYLRGGGILALDPDPAEFARVPDRLEVLLVPGGQGTLTLFEDDGRSPLDAGHAARVTRLTWEEHEGHGTLHIERSGEAPGARLFLRVPPGVAMRAVRANGTPLGAPYPLPEGGTVRVDVELDTTRP